MFGQTTRKISYKHNNQGKRYAYLNLPQDAVLGSQVKIVQLDEKRLLLQFE